MSDTKSAAEREVARTKAQSHFQAAEQRDKVVRDEIARERAATDAKTAKLRALRLAKEKEEAEHQASAPAPQAKTPGKRKRTVSAH